LKGPRALFRRRRRVEGFVDGCVAGEIRGWALAPGEPGRRVHVVALCEGRVVAEALADLSRLDLLQDGRGDGRHGFRLRLPPELLDGTARTVRVEAVVAGARERLLRSDIEIRPQADEQERRAAAIQPRTQAPGEGRVALAIRGEGDESATRASWDAQDWPDCSLGAVEGAHTVLFARAGDVVSPGAARLLVEARPLADVITWDGRPEARALGVLLGESLGGFAVRGHVLKGAPSDLRELELELAKRPELRWAHLAAPLLTGDGDQAPAHERLAPARAAERITIGVWPADDGEAIEALAQLAAQAPQAELELLTLPETVAALRERLGPDAARCSIRPIDPPANGGEGAWLRVLSEAASGEAVVLAGAGVRLSGGLEELAAWSLHPLVGAATLELEDASGRRLGGLGLARDGSGWRAGAAHGSGYAPVLAAPAALLAVGRSRLAAVGGVDDRRFPGRGADLDLALRLRRAGWHGLRLAGSPARTASLPPDLKGSELAAFDPAELAAAAAAFPAGDAQ
jgi:hypothetical protein